MKGNLLRGARIVGSGIRKNSTLLLTIGTIFGVGTVVFTTAKAAVKTKEDLDNLHEWQEDVTKKDIAKVVAKDCWPVALSAGATVAMTISNHKINSDRIHTATVAYEFYKEAYETYKDKVREKFGESAEKETEASIVGDKIKKHYIPEAIYDTGEGDILFIESKSGRVLRASREYIRRCEKEFNQMIRGEDWLSFNNWLNCLNVRMMDEDFGDLLGFREIYDHDALNVDFIPSNEIFPSGETATLIVYKDDLCTEGDRRCIGY